MRRSRIKWSCTFFLAVITLLASPVYTHAATGRQMAESAIVSLKSKALTVTTRNVPTIEWSWFEVNFCDETYPLTVDFMGSNFQCPRKIIYLLPGGGVNFRSSFLTPTEDNLAQFFRKKGYLVVGITPREDNVPILLSYRCMESWGMEKHRLDIRKIIGIIQGKLGLPYTILGHSFGAAYALDYASRYSDSALERIIALDIYSFGPDDTEAIGKSARSRDAYQELINEGTYADSSYSPMKALMLAAALFPNLDSGEPRTALGYPGNFTYEDLLYFSLIRSSLLDGTATPKTGLPGDWPLVRSYAAGWYVPAQDPADDQYHLAKSSMGVLRDASLKIGSGLVPCALYRDFYAVNAGTGPYFINWSAITKPVLWINTQFGYGGKMYGADLMGSCETDQITGYGHLDALASPTAKDEVWSLFVE